MQSFANGCGFKYQLTRLNTPDLPLLMSERRDFWWAFGKPHTSIPFGLLGIWNLLHHPHVKGHACKSFHLFCCTKKKEKKKARVDWGSNCWRAKRTKKMKSIGYEKRKKQKRHSSSLASSCFPSSSPTFIPCTVLPSRFVHFEPSDSPSDGSRFFVSR